MAVFKTFQCYSGLELAFISFIGFFYSLISEPKKLHFCLFYFNWLMQSCLWASPKVCALAYAFLTSRVEELGTTHFRNI